MVRHFLRDDDLSPPEQAEVLTLASKLKADRFAIKPLTGPRAIAVIFDKPSTRTRVSFSVGVAELGGFPLVIDAATSQLSRGELVADTAKVLSRQCAAIVWRTFGQDRLEEAAAVSTVPVINALSDTFHPCQVLADLLTLSEKFDSLAGLTLAFLGDTTSNMAHSYALGMVTAGMHVRLAGPDRYPPLAEIVESAHNIGKHTGGSLRLVDGPQAAVSGADVVATDTWASMGQETATANRIKDLWSYQLHASLLTHAKPDALVLHCLPAHRGEEITAEVLDGPQSVVWDQAENRLHAQKALLVWLLAKAEGQV